jgi:predicted amino acid-binding ACT domain protein
MHVSVYMHRSDRLHTVNIGDIHQEARPSWITVRAMVGTKNPEAEITYFSDKPADLEKLGNAFLNAAQELRAVHEQAEEA